MGSPVNLMIVQGNLAIIHDEETNNFVFSLTGGVNTWLGLRRVGPLVDPKPRNREDLFYFCISD